MKRFFIVGLIVVLLFSCSLTVFAQENATDFGAYQSVVIVGVDGAGAFFDNTATPSMDRIFSQNAFVENHAYAETVTSSAQNWASILMGVSCEEHQIDNATADVVERSSSEKYPTVFRLIREHDPDAALASIVNWNSINVGIVENDLGVYKDRGSDAEVCQKVISYLESNDSTLLFIQLDNVDHEGHTYGYGSSEHLKAITEADGYIGQIYDAIEKKGAAEDTLFIVVSDHGGTKSLFGGGGHGGRSFGEKLVYLGVKGTTVNANQTYGVRNRDIAAIVLHALGIAPAEAMTANIPNGLFAGLPAAEPTAKDIGIRCFHAAVYSVVNLFAFPGVTTASCIFLVVAALGLGIFLSRKFLLKKTKK